MNLKKYSILASSLLLSSAFFTAPSAAVNSNQNQGINSESTTLPNQNEYLVAQAADSCRQITARTSLNVRREPSLNSPVVGTINSGRNVTIQNLGTNGWVPIAAPVEGYVSANFLASCGADVATLPPTSCRRVVAQRGTNVWQAPSTDTQSLGLVARGRRVTIDNLGENGWVPITVPLAGFVQAENLGYCVN
jgi:uncharacterized protein YgiM (DUF1202 family)